MSDQDLNELLEDIASEQNNHLVKTEDKIQFMDLVRGNQYKMNNSPCSNDDEIIQYKSDLDRPISKSLTIETNDHIACLKEQMIDLYLNVKIRKNVMIPGFYDDRIKQEKEVLMQMNLPCQTLLNYVKESIEILMRINLHDIITQGHTNGIINDIDEAFCLNCNAVNKGRKSKPQIQKKKLTLQNDHENEKIKKYDSKLYKKMSNISTPTESLQMVHPAYEKQLQNYEKEIRTQLQTENKLRIVAELLQDKLEGSRKDMEPLSKEIKQLKAERDTLKSELAAIQKVVKDLKTNDAKLLQSLTQMRQSNENYKSQVQQLNHQLMLQNQGRSFAGKAQRHVPQNSHTDKEGLPLNDSIYSQMSKSQYLTLSTADIRKNKPPVTEINGTRKNAWSRNDANKPGEKILRTSASNLNTSSNFQELNPYNESGGVTNVLSKKRNSDQELNFVQNNIYIYQQQKKQIEEIVKQNSEILSQGSQKQQRHVRNNRRLLNANPQSLTGQQSNTIKPQAQYLNLRNKSSEFFSRNNSNPNIQRPTTSQNSKINQGKTAVFKSFKIRNKNNLSYKDEYVQQFQQ